MRLPEKVLRRMTLYHFILNDLRKDEQYISSTKIAQLLKIDDSQVRKDIKYLSNSGKCRVGYEVKQLKKAIEDFLGFNQKQDAFIIGAGTLGSALANYDVFNNYGVNILALFDNDSAKVGTTINGKEVFDITKVPNLASRLNVEVAILAVPKEQAKGLAQYLIAAGIKYIWNFTPCVLEVPQNVKVLNENFIGSFVQFMHGDTK